jgi:hypothetical protein
MIVCPATDTFALEKQIDEMVYALFGLTQEDITIVEIAKRLKADFGKEFDQSNLWHMRSFYLAFPILDAVRRVLTWAHYRLLLRVK